MFMPELTFQRALAAALITLLAIPSVVWIAHKRRHYGETRAEVVAQKRGVELGERLQDFGVGLGDPVMIRGFKKERVLELWVLKGERYELFQTYPICAVSGELGPKLAEGDRQAPEGVYDVTLERLNPFSSYHLAMNIGYPNAFDRQHDRTGSYIMIHGDCRSIGCFAIEDGPIEEVYMIVEAALHNQASVPVHLFPFRMTPENMRAHRENKWAPFWESLAPIYDAFERDRVPPEVAAKDGVYRLVE